jgi:tRNA threonylcarbamoyladenosine biosynthesis protein TsaB
MKILAMDTSTLVMGVAVLEEDRVLGELTTNMHRNHSVRLMPAIDRLLRELALSVDDLDAVAVAQGPGSYTGVRIGVTTAKTIAWSRKLPLIGVSSLAVLAMNGRHFDGGIVPLFDARRERAYTGLYQRTDDGLVQKAREERVVPVEQWLSELSGLGPMLFLGDDVHRFRAQIEAALGNQAVFGCPPENVPRASMLGQLAYVRWQRGEVADEGFAPNYLQKTEAEVNFSARQQTE